MSLTALGVQGRLYDVLSGADEAHDEIALHRGRVLVMNRMMIDKDGRRLGSVTTLRDRTELAQLERELGSFRSSTELLRAQAHEFANQLHIGLALTQLVCRRRGGEVAVTNTADGAMFTARMSVGRLAMEVSR
ncbi:hypothetical protein [Nonomuraea jabiensis]|uniref:hypothetical protein n=1 Tax=Nonomuraea jabiensis TaxID=882448 RepID=UPI0036B22DFB